MATIWERVRSLEGRTLQTAKQKKQFDIIEVTHDRVIFVPKEGNATSRWFPRKNIEQLYDLRLDKGSLEPRDVRELWPSDQNTSYVPVIVNEIYRLGNAESTASDAFATSEPRGNPQSSHLTSENRSVPAQSLPRGRSMSKLVKLSVGNQGTDTNRTILVEVPEDGEVKGFVTADSVIEKFDQTFDDLVQNEIVQNCKVLVGAFQQLADLPLKPKTAHVEFGLQFTAEGNIYVVKSSAQASYTVSFDWDFSEAK